MTSKSTPNAFLSDGAVRVLPTFFSLSAGMEPALLRIDELIITFSNCVPKPDTRFNKMEIFNKSDNYEDCYLECDKKSGDLCHSIRRLFTALNYYSSLDILHDEQDQNKFSEFINAVFPDFINDYIHFIDQHDEDIINHINQYFNVCDISQCQFTSRHYQSAELIEDQQLSLDQKLVVYQKLFDALHFYLHHLFQTGLRISKQELTEHMTEHNMDVHNCDDNYDHVFDRMNQLIRGRRHFTKDFHRFKSNTKFIMKGLSSTITFMDAVLQQTHSQSLRRFLVIEGYDTDALREDVGQHFNGNINDDIFDSIEIQKLRSFIQHQSVQAGSFCIGYTFYYWPHYKNMITFDQNHDGNINLHGGHQIKDLCIERKYDTFQEEIQNYPFINYKVYRRIVARKLATYMKSAKVKQMKANIIYNEFLVKLKYEIRTNSKILPDHLRALILYTDFSDHCTHFSATFRAMPFETLSSVKSRNSAYYWMSRRLREYVQLFGKKGDEFPNKSFFSGINFEAVFPSIEIRLCSPTSTSVHKAVATRFASEDGIIVHFKNPKLGRGDTLTDCVDFENGFYTLHCQDIRAIPCGWISQFSEESEYLFMGGHYRISIASISIITSARVYSAACDALRVIERIISGKKVTSSTVNEVVRQKMKAFKTWALCKKAEGAKNVDEYLMQTFQVFCMNQTQINLNLSVLLKDFKPHDMEMLGLFISDLKWNIGFKEASCSLNKSMFTIFPNTRRVIIDISSEHQFSYVKVRLDMDGLLTKIKDLNCQDFIIRGTYQKDSKKLHDIDWMRNEEDLVQNYSAHGFDIKFESSEMRLPHLVLEHVQHRLCVSRH